MQGKVDRKRRRGRPRRGWLDEITEKLGLDLDYLQQIGTNGERQFMKSPGIDINLTDDDDDDGDDRMLLCTKLTCFLTY